MTLEKFQVNKLWRSEMIEQTDHLIAARGVKLGIFSHCVVAEFVWVKC